MLSILHALRKKDCSAAKYLVKTNVGVVIGFQRKAAKLFSTVKHLSPVAFS